jgi:hypothetical protein
MTGFPMHTPKEGWYQHPVMHGLIDLGSGLPPFIGKDCFLAHQAAMM